MKGKTHNILLLGSDVSISNLPIKEVSLLKEGSLPAYGYNPGDFIELLAGHVFHEEGRLSQCEAWLNKGLEMAGPVRVRTVKYGDRKQVYQIFRRRRRDKAARGGHGWFMFQQILPPEGRSNESAQVRIQDSDERFNDNDGIIVIDDSSRPPDIAEEVFGRNKKAWVIGMGISIANWQHWARRFGDKFFLFSRLSDLETTRMEMDASVIWESLVAMAIRALKGGESGLWDEGQCKFVCHIIVEMYPYGILYLGPAGILFRHFEKALPQKSASRQNGSVPCYDTMVTSMLAIDFLSSENATFSCKYFFDFSRRVLANWQLLDRNGYYFSGGLQFPQLVIGENEQALSDFSARDMRCDPYFIELPVNSVQFNQVVELAACQNWNEEKKRAFRHLFPQKSRFAETIQKEHDLPEGPLGVIIEVLHYLKEEVSWKRGFDAMRLFSVGNLRTTDPVEIEPIITLKRVMDSYIKRETFQRPLCVGVFGPPGSGKSFAVKEVAKAIARKIDENPFEFFEFNLTQFGNPEEINSSIEAIRASVAKGKVPIVFWDEFDCRYGNQAFGYLRYFLPSMQDGVTYVHGSPYNIGRSIFVFAGGIKSSWDEMVALIHSEDPDQERMARNQKIPDFMSRLRVVIDIDAIDLSETMLNPSATADDLDDLRRILLKRAFIIAHQMDTHWKKAARKTSGLLLRLLLADYKFGARSIEAVIEASGAADRLVYGLPELIAPAAARIHAKWRTRLEREVDLIRKQHGIRAVW
ncbi:MAG: AAA family ATPase [Desulfosarcinaceae bacterium]